MGSLYASRLCRADILSAITRLAEQFHKWTPLSTRKLHRLMEYYNHTKSYKQNAFIGDDWSELEVAVFVDAAWASDRSDYKSTTGGLLVLLGANSFSRWHLCPRNKDVLAYPPLKQKWWR